MFTKDLFRRTDSRGCCDDGKTKQVTVHSIRFSVIKVIVQHRRMCGGAGVPQLSWDRSQPQPPTELYIGWLSTPFLWERSHFWRWFSPVLWVVDPIFMGWDPIFMVSTPFFTGSTPFFMGVIWLSEPCARELMNDVGYLSLSSAHNILSFNAANKQKNSTIDITHTAPRHFVRWDHHTTTASTLLCLCRLGLEAVDTRCSKILILFVLWCMFYTPIPSTTDTIIIC